MKENMSASLFLLDFNDLLQAAAAYGLPTADRRLWTPDRRSPLAESDPLSRARSFSETVLLLPIQAVLTHSVVALALVIEWCAVRASPT